MYILRPRRCFADDLLKYFSLMRMWKFRLRSHWRVSLRVQLTTPDPMSTKINEATWGIQHTLSYMIIWLKCLLKLICTCIQVYNALLPCIYWIWIAHRKKRNSNDRLSTSLRKYENRWKFCLGILPNATWYSVNRHESSRCNSIIIRSLNFKANISFIMIWCGMHHMIIGFCKTTQANVPLSAATKHKRMYISSTVSS